MLSGTGRVALAAFASSVLLCTPATSGELKFEAGLGYDFISQEFFLDSIARGAGDSLDFALKTDYLDDVKGRLVLRYSPFRDRRLNLTSSYEQAADFLRGRFLADARTRLGAARLDVSTEFDWKHRYGDTDESGDSYRYGYVRSRLALPVSASLAARFQVTGEAVGFDSVSGFYYDYYRLGGKLGLANTSDNLNITDVDLFVTTRQVSDSTRLNYVAWGAEASFLGSLGPFETDLTARLERKNYNQPDGEDDYYTAELRGNGKIMLGENYFSRQELELDLTSYHASDPVNRDYTRIGGTFLTGYQKGGFSLALGPAFEALRVSQDESVEGEDYFEGGARVDLDLVNAASFFGAIESVFGYRDVKFTSDLQSSFTFERLNLIGDLTVWRGLALNLLFSAEWEWHRGETEDSRLLLLSSSLTYTF